MAKLSALKAHQTWEDLFAAALGVLILISPVIAEGVMPPVIMYSTLAVGIVVLGLSLFEIMLAGRWEEIIGFLAGVWLAVSVFVLDYGTAPQLRIWHFVLGALVALMAAIEFWQDSMKKEA